MYLDLKLDETEIEKWCKDNELVYLNEINVHLINKTLLTKVPIAEFKSVNWTLEKLKTIISEKYEITLNAIAFSHQEKDLSSLYDYKCQLQDLVNERNRSEPVTLRPRASPQTQS